MDVVSSMLFLYFLTFVIIQLIPQGTIDSNLGPDRLAGWQTTNSLIARPLYGSPNCVLY